MASSGPLGDLELSESKDKSKPDFPGDGDNEGDPNVTKQYCPDPEDEAADSGSKPDSSTTAATDQTAVPGNPGNPDGSDAGAPAKDAQPTKTMPTTQLSAAAQGIQE